MRNSIPRAGDAGRTSSGRNPDVLKRIVFAAALMAATPVLAQVDPEILRDTAGRYKVSDGKVSCIIVLKTDPSIGGMEAEVPAACGKLSARLAEAGVWSLDDGGIVLADTMRRRIVLFEEQEGGPYETREQPGPRMWTLSALDVAPPLTPAQQMTGRWSLYKDTEKVCELTTTSNAAGLAGTVAPGKGCGAEAGAWARWTRKGELLTLLDKGGKTARLLRRTDPATFSNQKLYLDLIKEVP